MIAVDYRRSWRSIAELTLEHDPETRQEFSGRKYEVLNYEQQEHLKHRIREVSAVTPSAWESRSHPHSNQSCSCLRVMARKRRVILPGSKSRFFAP